MLKKAVLSVLAVALIAVAYSVRAEEEKDAKFSAVCPVSGKPAKESAAVAYKDAKVYFCCPNCPKAFAADTGKFAAKANHQLVATGQAKQAKCPLTGKACAADKTVEVGGVKVAFCCPGCQGKVAKAEGDAQVTLVFGDAPFAKGFAIKKAEKK